MEHGITKCPDSSLGAVLPSQNLLFSNEVIVELQKNRYELMGFPFSSLDMRRIVPGGAAARLPGGILFWSKCGYYFSSAFSQNYNPCYAF